MTLNPAQLYDLLIPIHASREIKSIINCDNDIAQKIILNADEKIIYKMSNLLDTMQNIHEPKLVKNNLKN